MAVDLATINGVAIGNIGAIDYVNISNLAEWNKVQLVPDPYCSQYRTVYNAFATKPGDSSALIQNTFVKKLVDDGTWAKIDVMWIFAANTTNASEWAVNWKSPGTYNCTVGAGTVTITTYTGASVTRTDTNWIQTNWSPKNNGVNYALGQEAAGYYTRQYNQGTYNMGDRDTNTNTYILIRNQQSVNSIQAYLDSSAGANYATVAKMGMIMGTRDATNVTSVIANGTIFATQVGTVSGDRAVNNVHILGYDNNGTHAGNASNAQQVSMAFLGGGFTNADISTMYVGFQAYMTSFGTQV